MEKIALITGANRGLGFEIARQLAAKGMIVLLGARNKAAGEAAAARIPNAVYLPLDITDTNSIANAAKIVAAQYGRLDVLVNNAARLPKPGEENGPSTIPLELLQEYIHINFIAQVAVTQAFLPLIHKSPAGRIVNMSSTIGSNTIMAEHLHENGPKPARLAYGSSKVALNMFTIVLAKELAVHSKIKINAADPGLTQTDAGGPHAPNTVEQGAKPAVWLACLDDDGPTGCFFTHRLTHLNVNPW